MATKKKYQSGGPAKDPRKKGEKRSLTAAELMVMQKQNPEIKKAIVEKYKTSTPEGYKFGKTSMDSVAASNMGLPLKQFDVVKKKGVIIGNRKKPATSTKDAMDIMRKGGTVKPLAKKQAGGSSKTTPFKDYLKSNKSASASDTVAMTSFGGKRSATKSGAMDIKAKNPKNQKALESAYEKTYGQDIKNRITNPAPGETNDQYNRRMGYKKGGAVKKAVIKKTVVVKKKK